MSLVYLSHMHITAYNAIYNYFSYKTLYIQTLMLLYIIDDHESTHIYA